MQLPEIESALALITHGESEASDTEARRQARYRNEDAERVAVRAREDSLRDGGAAVRAARRAELNAMKDALINTPVKKAVDSVAALNEKVSQLEAMVKAAATAPVASTAEAAAPAA